MKEFNFEKIIQQQFDALIKKVVNNRIKDHQRNTGRRLKHERPFADLPDFDIENIGLFDERFIGIIPFFVEEIPVYVRHEELGDALGELDEKQKKIILMFYFLNMSDAEIAKILKKGRTTIFETRKRALEILKKKIGDES